MMGVGLIALLLPTVHAQTVDSKLERLERLERALQIEDCVYAVEELEHLNVSYSDIALKYALLAEGYLCIGKPAKSKLAVQEFARLGGEANQLSMRVQEYCALQECALSPVLVKPVEQETTAVTDMESTSTVVNLMEETIEEVEEVRIEPAKEAIHSPSVETIIEVDVEIATPVEELVKSAVPEPSTVDGSDPLVDEVDELSKVEENGHNEQKESETVEVRIEPSPSIEEPIEEPEPEPVVAETAPVELPTVSEGATLFTVEEINGMVIDGQCAEAAVAGANLLAVEPENALGHMAFGDSLACYPEGSGDIFSAFDAWMIAKSLAKTQQLDWQPMKDRLGWALQRSGILKIIPEFEDGYTDWPEDFSIELESNVDINLAPRTDRMLGGIYLTNLPEGEATLRITPGGARPDVVTTLTIAAGELQKIRVPIGPEKHIRLPSLPTPEGYFVTLLNSAGDTVAYHPHEEQLILKDTYTATVQYGEQNYEFEADLDAIANDDTPSQSFRGLLPWVYQVRNAEGVLLAEGLVPAEQSGQGVRVDLATESYVNWRDGTTTQIDGESVNLVASGTISEMEESLFTELVIDPSLHPFYDTAEELYALEQDLTATTKSTQWLTGTMLTAGVWTGVSLAFANGDNENAGFWESQAVAGSMLTVPMVAIWMNEKLRVEPSQNRQGQSLYSELMAMNGDAVSFDSLVPMSESVSEERVETEDFEEEDSENTAEEFTLSEDDQSTEETEAVEQVSVQEEEAEEPEESSEEAQEAEAVEDPEQSDGDSSQ